MLEWHDFVEQLLSEESSFDGISLSFDGTAHSGSPSHYQSQRTDA